MSFITSEDLQEAAECVNQGRLLYPEDNIRLYRTIHTMDRDQRYEWWMQAGEQVWSMCQIVGLSQGDLTSEFDCDQNDLEQWFDPFSCSDRFSLKSDTTPGPLDKDEQATLIEMMRDRLFARVVDSYCAHGCSVHDPRSRDDLYVELASHFETSLATIRRWATGNVVPHELMQQTIVDYIDDQLTPEGDSS
mgnify:CR=1 FL=1